MTSVLPSFPLNWRHWLCVSHWVLDVLILKGWNSEGVVTFTLRFWTLSFVVTTEMLLYLQMGHKDVFSDRRTKIFDRVLDWWW